MLGVPGRPIVKIDRRLDAHRAFLVTRSGLIATDVLGYVGIGVAKWLDFSSLQIDSHQLLLGVL
ncbi:hypothetical protein THIARS_80290 [Thiomonas delicata]|uniref:Uncharacterized protein n=1 Tax=Thiomonas delicata TaxID=364030 RepID=A0A238D8Y3_THIDL|nr:hypothetical protein THIARS_80290 [Thiomonas delicata]